MTSNFTPLRGWTLRGNGEKGFSSPDGRSGPTTDLASRDLFSIRRSRGCWGRSCALWSGVLRGESVCAADCLHAQRFCGATGVRADAAGVADGDGTLRASGESPWLAFAGHGALRISVRDGVAFQCASRRGGELQRGTYFRVGCACGKIAAAVVARRGWTGTGVWIDKFLSFAGGV